jgi:hypothetical protein
VSLCVKNILPQDVAANCVCYGLKESNFDKNSDLFLTGGGEGQPLAPPEVFTIAL